MTTISREFRLRIHAAGTTTPADGTVAYTFDSEIREPPQVGGQTVRILAGRSESQPWQVKLVDASGAVTAVLGDASDRAQLGYRIADISKNDDASGWDILATGRISGIDLDDIAGYVISVQDERVVERNTTLWRGAPGTTTVWGAGFAAGSYGPFTNPVIDAVKGDSPTRAFFERVDRTGNATIVTFRPSHTPEFGSSGLLDLIQDDVSIDVESVISAPGSAAAGSYRTLRLRMEGEGSDREIIGFRTPGLPLTLTNLDGRLNALGAMYVYDPSNNLATGTGYLYTPGAEPTEQVPVHVEARPGDLLVSIYDGDYSDGISVRYDAAAMTALQSRLQADGVGTLRWRILGTEKMSSWLEDNIYQPLGIVPLIGADGSVKPVKVYPTTVEVADPDNLYEFTESDVNLLGWRYAPEEAVSLVRGTYPRESQINVPLDKIDERYETGSPLDTLEETDHEHEIAHDAQVDADRVLELSLRGWHDRARVEQFMALRAGEVFEMFGDGPLYITLRAFSASEGVGAGDYVIVDHSALPSPTGQRGDSRICFVLSRTALPNGFQFEMIEVGPSLQPLAAPTLAVVQSGNGVTLTISNMPAAATSWEIRTHDGDSASAPTDSDPGWRGVGQVPATSTTHTIAQIKHGVKVWFQARARATGRIPSDWSTAVDITVTALTAPSNLTITEQGGVYLRATFTPGEASLPTQVFLNGTERMWLAAGSDGFMLRGLSPNTTYDAPGLQVRHIDPQTGATSAFDTVPFTTLSAPEVAPTYIAAVLLIGDSG